jgi:hypothetical protein
MTAWTGSTAGGGGGGGGTTHARRTHAATNFGGAARWAAGAAGGDGDGGACRDFEFPIQPGDVVGASVTMVRPWCAALLWRALLLRVLCVLCVNEVFLVSMTCSSIAGAGRVSDIALRRIGQSEEALVAARAVGSRRRRCRLLTLRDWIYCRTAAPPLQVRLRGRVVLDSVRRHALHIAVVS